MWHMSAFHHNKYSNTQYNNLDIISLRGLYRVWIKAVQRQIRAVWAIYSAWNDPRTPCLKQPLGMTSIFFLSCFKHVFIFFRIFIFLQIFLINISMKPEETQTNYLYTWRTIDCFHSIGPHANGIGLALGRQSVLQVCTPVSWLWDTN